MSLRGARSATKQSLRHRLLRCAGNDTHIAVFCSGFGSNFQAILDAIRRGRLPARVAVMVCDDPKAFALARAQRHGVPVFLFNPKAFAGRRDYERLIVRVLKSQKVDLVVLAGFMRILTPYFVKAYRGRILNIHPSLLPAFKGARAIRDAFEAGVAETGVTVHEVTADVDAGPVVVQRKVKILPRDSLRSLEARIHRLEHYLYPAAIQKFINHLLE